jgi:hypothetical protein
MPAKFKKLVNECEASVHLLEDHDSQVFVPGWSQRRFSFSYIATLTVAAGIVSALLTAAFCYGWFALRMNSICTTHVSSGCKDLSLCSAAEPG